MEDKIKLFERKRRKELSHRCGVYAIFVKDYIYVGSSEDLSRRLTEHRMTIPKGKKGCRILNELYANNSKDDFYYSILEYCTPEDRLEKEKYYIEALKANCNTAKNPKNPVTHNIPIYQYSINGDYINEFVSITDAARKIKGSEGNISTAASQHRYAYNSLWAYEKENKYPHTPKTKLKTKKVYMFKKESKALVHEFESISDAARFLLSIHNEFKSFNSLCVLIKQNCIGQQKKGFNGFFFKFSKTIFIPKEQKQ